MNDMVTIPRAEYDRLLSAAEVLSDLAAYDRAKARLAAGKKCLGLWLIANSGMNAEVAAQAART